jgi:hypothetical protein
MAEIHYWLLVHEPWFGDTEYFRFDKQGNESATANPALAMRWQDLYAAEYAGGMLSGQWTPKLIAFDGDALCGGASPSPTSMQ